MASETKDEVQGKRVSIRSLISATLERRILSGLPLPFVTKSIHRSADSLVSESAKSPPILFSEPTENVKESKGFLAAFSGIDGSSFRAAIVRERPFRAVRGIREGKRPREPFHDPGTQTRFPADRSTCGLYSFKTFKEPIK
jgi:hypothetical protein